jgi:putative ABC transport system substrate-binding protein
MNKTFGSRHRDSPSDNRKSKIKNPKFALVGALLFALCFPAEAQQPTKIPRIGVLRSGSAGSHASSHEVFRQGLRELGYEEAKNILIEYRYAEGKSERWPTLANELVLK